MSIHASHADELMAEINIAAITTPPGFQRKFAHGLVPAAGAPRRPVTVRIGARTQVWIDDQRDASQLYPTMLSTVQEHAGDGESTRVLLFADADTRYDLIIKILDAARQAGDDDVSMVVK